MSEVPLSLPPANAIILYPHLLSTKTSLLRQQFSRGFITTYYYNYYNLYKEHPSPPPKKANILIKPPPPAPLLARKKKKFIARFENDSLAHRCAIVLLLQVTSEAFSVVVVYRGRESDWGEDKM